MILYETAHFVIKSEPKPHVSRKDGGHLVIFPREPVVHRWNSDVERATALVRLSMLAGEAMLAALNERDVPVERINFQDNGNWAIGTSGGPKFHLHLYGRARGSQHQVHGEALSFPFRDDFAKQAPLEPLNEGDREAISSRIEKLACEERYRLSAWNLRQG